MPLLLNSHALHLLIAQMPLQQVAYYLFHKYLHSHR
jgi:hypothetical protein